MAFAADAQICHSCMPCRQSGQAKLAQIAAGTRGHPLGQMRTEQAGDGPGQRAVLDRNLGARENRLVRCLRYLRRPRPGPIR